MTTHTPIVPPHPTRRQADLPWQRPKAVADDRNAQAAVRAILKHPSYRPAAQDVAFLDQPETRGIRLQLDYAKAESLLCRHGIDHTIVVFGGTRIPEPRAAHRHAEACSNALAAEPNDPLRQRHATVAQRLLDNSRYYDIARAFGALVGCAGNGAGGGRIMIMTGGGPGVMEAANRGAHDQGCGSIGLNITLPQEQYPNPYVSPELCFSFHYFAIRKLHFLLRARALVFFPGGFGTFDELFEILTLVQTRKIAPLPVVLIGETWWRRAFDVDFLVAEGMIDPEDRDLFWYAETAEEAWNSILRWYDSAGMPLVSTGAGP